jgi:lysophospholipase L1-like esterase
LQIHEGEAIKVRWRNLLIEEIPEEVKEVKLDSSLTKVDIYKPMVEVFNWLPHSKKDIVFLGNSITFWGAWADLIGSRNVKNRGIPGDITFGVLNRLDEIIDGKPSKVFILIGINDLARNIPDSIILSNYQKIIGKIKSGSPSTKIYFQTLLPTNNILNRKSSIYNHNENIIKINDAMKEIAVKDNRFILIDTYSIFADELGNMRKEYTWDGVHLNLSGYKRWVELLKNGKYLKKSN